MATIMQIESTEFAYVGVTGTVPNSAEMAFLTASARPLEADWQDGILITSTGDALWNDAKASGVTGTYFVGLLIGDYNANPYSLAAGLYQSWVRLNGDTEQVVLIAPTMFQVAG